ncbi:phytanoyl-CoA dioxygenase family protein [Paenibacillus qinlingensis]|uniref:phytanoyl-CoA dioxygenase family protein n=1 Tax=Paenibacillus qinlingensis TaxID=1837343 RepID=UPI00156626A8|nr:phytanoyl-CoA dioxygenase family protein [Paenibacillus qinlingensis]NQX58745.1 phytanoyl-CoA dioxygenase family protein [Paenibacillus qinlingensis]
MLKISESGAAQYQEKGYYLYKQQLFSEDKLNRIESIFDDHLREKGSKLSDELDRPHIRDPRLLEFLLSDEVLDVVEPIIGPNIALWSSHFICKDPYVGRATPWHEDSAYWKGRASSFENIVTVWLAIDRSNKENGCMRVIPGTHAGGFSDYEKIDASTNTFDTQIKGVDESAAVYFELERGECSLHDSRIIHGATANESPFRRCGYTMRYFSADTKVLDKREIWLARGKDLAGNVYQNV